MKANELMVGDCVRCGKRYMKVTQLAEDMDCDDIEPIPLTPEILEKNGFECKHKGEALKRMYWILYIEGGSVKVKTNRGLFLFSILGVPFQHRFYIPSVNKHIQYVHDLQHTLRLCGITREIIL